MKAIRISQVGDPSVTGLLDIPQTKPGPGDAPVRREGCGHLFISDGSRGQFGRWDRDPIACL